jgi:hypothetical protein
MAMESTFRQNASQMLKPNNAFVALLGKWNYRIAFDEWYDTRNTKTYLFNPSDDSKSQNN